MTIRQLCNAAVAILASLNYAMPADSGADAIRHAVTLRASFDEAVRADHGRGELSMSTRFNHQTEKNRFVFEKGFDPAVFRVAPKSGIVGGALEAVDVLPHNGRIFFPARGNIAYRKGGWAGSVSVWLKTDPNNMLKTSFCDPVQITERGAGNGGIWFDFNDAKPRDLRMGTFPAVPAGGKPIQESDPSAPIIFFKGVGFKATEWHHVALVWEGFDTGRSNARAALYIDGKPIGELKDREIGMEWDLDKAGIYIAVGYIGLLDEFAVFNRALTPAEIGLLFQRPGLLSNRQQPGDLRTLARQSLATIDGQLSVTGLEKPVEVIRDRWGIPHIYAQTVVDLFFAQGYVTAQDRLWQMEWWRRQREGRLAEILGPAVVERDRQARLTRFRGPFDEREWTTYHPEGKRLFSAYVKGINAYIADNAQNLPVEFKLTGTRPEPWTPETVLLRANERALADAAAELRLARSVAQQGVAGANRVAAPDPWDNLTVPDGLNVSIIGEDVLQSVRVGGRGPSVGLPKPEIVEPYRKFFLPASAWMPLDLIREPGSNNWVMSGKMTTTGKPMVVNDPHREVTNPSLRYIVHLNAPGWNVIGASEAPFIGVHIGHNANLGWGMTVVGMDQVDVVVEELNPRNANEVLYNGKWEPLRIVREEIKVKGEAPREVELKFSRHGAVFYEDTEHKRAYVLRSVMDEPGTAWYLGSLRLAQAANCRAFLDAAMYWKTPSENLICGDTDGNIAWQASGMAPSRAGWSGRLPVPGTGKYEWQGFRQDLPREFNPDRGFVATANHNIQPKGYSPPLMFKNPQAAERITRILQIIKPGKKFSIEDQKNLQLDMYLTRAEQDLRLFEGWKAQKTEVEFAREALLKWNKTLQRESMEAALYIAWNEAVDPKVRDAGTPQDRRFELAKAGLEKAIQRLTSEQGPDRQQWRYGRLHTRTFPHPFVSEFDLPTVERGGGAGAVAADGASYREILDAGDWDRSVVTQVPGQSGQPESKFYGNLLPLWADNEYFPLAFSRKAVDQYAAHRMILKPR